MLHLLLLNSTLHVHLRGCFEKISAVQRIGTLGLLSVKRPKGDINTSSELEFRNWPPLTSTAGLGTKLSVFPSPFQLKFIF